MIDCADILHAHNTVFTEPVTENIWGKLCPLLYYWCQISYSYLTLLCDRLLNQHQGYVTGAYSLVCQIVPSYLSCLLTWMFSIHNQGHRTSCLPFLSLNLETWHLIYLPCGLETIYKTGKICNYLTFMNSKWMGSEWDHWWSNLRVSDPAALFIHFQTLLHALPTCPVCLVFAEIHLGFRISVGFPCKILEQCTSQYK